MNRKRIWGWWFYDWASQPYATLLLTFCQPGDMIVHSGPLYAATETLIGRILGKFGVGWMDFPAGATEDETRSDKADVVREALRRL